MNASLLDLLRCPFCGTGLSLVDNAALARTERDIESGVLGCECCAFPIVAGIPVIMATEQARAAIGHLEGGRADEALTTLLELDAAGRREFRDLLARRPAMTYREAISILSPDAEGTYFIYRFSDPTFVVAQVMVQSLATVSGLGASGHILDLCGGSGHLTRELQQIGFAHHVVLADLYFWKLWLAKQFTSPDSQPVCCDANHPLPFRRASFSLVVLSDAFPYIWHKRLLAEEMMRLLQHQDAGGGTIVMPHLHSSLGDNFSAGMTLTPASYAELFWQMPVRLFSDRVLLQRTLDRSELDLTGDVSREQLGNEPSFMLIASSREEIFQKYDVPVPDRVRGELRINPLYRVDRRDGATVLTLTFPTPEYEAEFGACRQYLPSSLTVPVNLSGPITPELLGEDYAELRRRRVIIDVPLRYL